MSQQLITTSNADRDIYNGGSGATVLSATPDASNPRLCYVQIHLGDGTKNLSGVGGNFQVTITVGGNTWLGGAQTYSIGTATRTMLQTEAFFVPANAAVTVVVISPNSADTDVDCTAYLVSESSASATAVATIAGYLDTEIATIVSGVAAIETDTQDIQSRLPAALVSGRMDASVGAMASGVLTATAIASDAITAAKVASDVSTEIATAVVAAGDIDGYTVEQSMKLVLAGLAGKVSGADGTTVTFRAADDSKVRITATVDADGNRSALTLDATG